MDFEVRHIDGTTVNLISSEHKCAITSATQTRKLCGNDTVTINLQSATYIEFQVGDKITIFGTTYTLNQLPTVKKESERSYTYTLVFEGLQYTLIDRVFLMPANTQGDNLMFDLAGMLDVLDDNINRGNSGKPYEFVLDESLEETEYKNLSLTGKNCLQVLQQLCQVWNTEFVFAEEPTRIAIYIGVAGSTFPTTFKYGRGGGVYELNREKGASDICTRLFVYGGTQNLTYYRHNRLCLPSKEKNQSYVEDATAQAVYGIKEQVKNFDDIYPNRIGTITSLSGCDYNEFIDSAMADAEYGFDLNEKWANSADDCAEWLALKGLENTEANRTIYYNDVAGTATKYLMAGATAKIHFNTGALAGYECDLHSYTHSSQKFVLKPLVDENGYDFPSKTNAAFKLAVGDEYVILDINLPTAYKTQAESKLATEAASYFDTVCRPQPKYTLTIEPIALKHIVGPSTADTEIFKVGDLINISDPTGGVESATIRIDQFVRNLLDPFDYKLTLTDEITYSQQVRTLIEVDAIKRVVEESKIYDVNRIRRGWKDAEELFNLMFDTEGHYYSEKIAPLSIDTQMLKVGARSQQLVLQNVLFQPNYNANPANLQISAGSLVHYTIAEPDIKTWTMSALSASNVPSTAQYVYAKCARNGTTGTWLVTDQAIIFDSDPSYYHFLVGSLSSVDSVSNTRNFAATYGYTTINGRYITTGVIKSSDGSSVVIDLDAGKITGNIKFLSGGQAVDAEQFISDTVDDAVSEVEIGGRNLLPCQNFWEQGNTSDEANPNKTYEQMKTNASTRIRTKSVINLDTNSDYTINCGSGFEYYLVYLNNGYGAGWSGYKSEKYTFKPSGYDSVAVIVRKSDNSAITPSEIDNVKIKLEKGSVATDWTPASEDLPYDELVRNLTATCDTAASTATKVIVCPQLTPKMLNDGNLRIKVKFMNENSLPNAQTTDTLAFVFRNSASGSNITPQGASSANVYVTYRGADALRGPINYVRMPYWNDGQVAEFTFDNSRSTSTNTRLKFVDEAGFDTVSALYKAYGGSTEILGGLILTDTILAGKGSNQAGMNGLDTNDVAFFAGGSIGNAALGNIPVIITRNGDVKFGAVQIYGSGSGELVMFDPQNKSRFKLKNNALVLEAGKRAYNSNNHGDTHTFESGASLNETAIPTTEATHYFWGSSYQGGTPENIKGDTGASSGKYNTRFGVTFAINTNICNRDYYTYFHLNVDMWNGTTWVNIYSNDIQYRQLKQSVNTFGVSNMGVMYSNGPNAALVGLRLRYSADENDSLNVITSATASWTYYQDTTVAFMQIANNGMSYFASALQQFTVQRTGETALKTTIKGDVDIPGMLWAGRITSTGSISSTDYNCVGKSVASQRTATGTYKLTLSGFSASPTVLATIVNTVTSSPKGCSANVQSYSSSQVVIRTFSDNTLTDFEIHVVIFGKN